MLKVFREIGKKALDLVQKERNGRKIIGRNPLGQKTLRMDYELEGMVIDKLNELETGKILITEERGEIELRGDNLVFILDPLDGSNNYLRGIPVYCLAISVSENRMYSGITQSYVIDLANGDEFWAIKGKGAFRNGKKIYSSEETELGRCVIEYDCNLRDIEKLSPLMKVVRDTRRLGANILGLCYIASGAHHAFIDLRNSLSVIHVTGLRIAEEAGAIATDIAGNTLNPELRLRNVLSFVCSANKSIHKKILSLIEQS